MRCDARLQAPNTSCMGNAGNRSAEADTAVSIAVPQQQESAPNHSTISMRCARLPNMHSSCCGNSSLPAPTTHKAFVAAAIHKGNTHLQPERNRSQLHGSIRKQVKPTQCISTSSSRSPESSSHELQCPEHPYTCTVLQVIACCMVCSAPWHTAHVCTGYAGKVAGYIRYIIISLLCITSHWCQPPLRQIASRSRLAVISRRGNPPNRPNTGHCAARSACRATYERDFTRP